MIEITTLEQEQKFTEYHKRRGQIRDTLRFGVYPNLQKALQLYAAFMTDYSPGGAQHDPSLWAYYQNNIQPIVTQQADMIAAATAIVEIMQTIERAAPNTFGIQVSEPAP
ncbi:MAG: hypothetical protein KAX65_10475 [Caldilineaceae bacterium]|nr:hypothetical protein [Caldilineaceae bacterium]